MHRRRVLDLVRALALVALLIPLTASAASSRQAAPEAAAAPMWRNLLNETFEGAFPSGSWTVRDHNGSAVGVKLNETASLVWDDNPIRARTGAWSAHPNDSNGYAHHTDTWMRYGPINLSGAGNRRAQNARLLFGYWLDTETHYDYFSVDYACANNGNWTSAMYSGPIRAWVNGNISLAACLGQSAVYVRFWFRSDYGGNDNAPPTGVWVDDIRVQKYSVAL